MMINSFAVVMIMMTNSFPVVTHKACTSVKDVLSCRICL